MNTALVWLLVTVSTGSYNAGNVTYGPPLATLEDCQRVRDSIREPFVKSYCVQTNIRVETTLELKNDRNKR